MEIMSNILKLLLCALGLLVAMPIALGALYVIACFVGQWGAVGLIMFALSAAWYLSKRRKNLTTDRNHIVDQ